MRRQATTCMLVLAILGMPAANPSTAQAPSSSKFDALKKEYEAAQKKFVVERMATQKEALKAWKEARTPEEKQAAQKKLQMSPADGPARQYAQRFLDFAAKNSRDPEAFEALVVALQICGPTVQKELWTKILEHLQAYYVARPEIGKIVRMLGNRPDDASAALVRQVIAKNPDHKIQGRACKALAEGRARAAKLAERLKADERLRKSLEQQAGLAYVAGLIANGDKAKKEAEELSRRVREQYADVFPVLAIGKPAPEVVSRDLAGKEVRLSDLKGKVVVLSIWSTASDPFRAMIPRLGELVGELKNKPFVLVSINADEKKTTLTDFLAREKMPWTHWWNGSQGGIVDDWDIQYFPLIYVLDTKGVIRYKDVRDDKLEEAVYALLKELDP